MNRDEAKSILLLYRHGTADAEDPQIAEALALAERDQELKDWLVVHCARQFVLRQKFRQIAAPAGLKEQIISEQAAQKRMLATRQKVRFALAAFVLLSGLLSFFWISHHAPEDTLAIYQRQMAGVALRGYAMDLLTNEPAPIRAFLAQHQAPGYFTLPVPLQQAALTGCAIEGWQGVKVSMICFRTGKPLAPGATSDLWLFVVDRAAVKNIPAAAAPQFSKISRLIIATWTQGDKLYLLGTDGDEAAIKPYL